MTPFQKNLRTLGRLTRAIRRARHKRFMVYTFECTFNEDGTIGPERKGWGISREQRVWELEISQNLEYKLSLFGDA